MKNSIYDYFYDKKTKQYLNKKVVDYVLELNEELDSLVKKAYNENIDEKEEKNIYLKIMRLKYKLEDLTEESIYNMDPQEVIDLYDEKYGYNIYHYFKDSLTKARLAKEVVDYILNDNQELVDFIIKVMGENYKKKIKPIADKKEYKALYHRLLRLKEKIESLSTISVYKLDPKEVIKLYQEKCELKGTIYNYFKDTLTGKCLSKEVVDYFLNTLSESKINNIILGLGENYKTEVIFNKNKTIFNRAKTIIYRLKNQIELLDENIYEKPTKEIIAIYEKIQGYNNTIYQYFKEAKTRRYLDPKIVDYLLKNEKGLEKFIISICGKNYTEKLEPITSKQYKELYFKIDRLKKKLKNILQEDIYSLSVDDFIKKYESKINFRKTIYYYFKDAKTGKHLDKKVVDLILDNLKEHEIKIFNLAFGSNFKEKIEFTNDVNILNYGKVTLSRLKSTIENVTSENIYEMSVDNLLLLLKEKYSYNISIYDYFKDKESGKLLDRKIVDFLIDTTNVNNRMNLYLTYGDDYKTEVNITKNRKMHIRGSATIIRLKNLIESLMGKDVYDMDFLEFLKVFKQYKWMNLILVENLLSNKDYLNYYLYFIQEEELFIKVSRDYSFDLALMLYFVTGKYLKRSFNRSELMEFFNLTLEELHSNLIVLNDLINKNNIYVLKRM